MQLTNQSKRMKRLLIVALCILFHANVFAAWNIPVENYKQKDYNAGTQNWQIKQQKNQWMYFANNYGLLEFDGQEWQLYGIWSSSVVRSVEIVPEDSAIYVGGTNEYGIFKPTPTGKLDFKPMSRNIPDEYKNFGQAWNLHWQNPYLYVQTDKYIFRQNKSGDFSVINPNAHIFCSAMIRDALFVATDQGVYLITGTQLNALQGSELLHGKVIKAIREYSSNKILIATDFNGIYVFDGDAIKPFKTSVDNFIINNQLMDMVVNDNHIAFGTILNGVAVTNLDGNDAIYINTENGLQNNTVLSMSFDKSGNLWLGLDHGIDRVLLNSPIQYLYGSVDSKGAGYTSCIYKDKLYLGTNQGLYVTQYPFKSNERKTQLSLVRKISGQVWNLSVINNTLFCCHNRGLYIINNQDGRPIDSRDGYWLIKPMHKHSNMAIAGSYNGLYLLKNEFGQWRISNIIKGYTSSTRMFELDKNDNIWILSTRGVERLILNDKLDSCTAKVMKKYPNNGYCSILPWEDEIIICSNGSCQMTDINSNLVDSVDFFNEILDGEKLYSAVKKSDNKDVWFMYGDVLKVRKYDHNAMRYESKTTEIWDYPNLYIGGFEHLQILNNTEAIVGCTSGFAMAKLNTVLHPNQGVWMKPTIRKLISTNQNDTIIYGESYPKIKKDIEIKYKNNSLRFIIDGYDNYNEHVLYSYCLSPIESDYNKWIRSNTKEYTNLSEGTYTLKIRTMSAASGQTAENSLEFTILPPWYRTWWAYLLYLIPIMYIIYLVYKYFKHRVEKGRLLLERRKDSEMQKQQLKYAEESHEREKEILRLQNEQTKIELKSKSQELANMMLSHLNKNEILTEIKKDLKKILGDLHGSNAEQISRKIIVLQGKITQNIEQEVDWNKFEENFDLVHSQFIQKLMKKYPMLNKKERKLCIYVKMGLFTKEIAPLMNMSVRGVEMLRFRMRKHMNLDRADDLEQLLEKI